MTPTDDATGIGIRNVATLNADMRPAFDEFARQVIRMNRALEDVGRDIRQALASYDRRGVPFWAHNPATAKRPRR
jgi:hypothetical protein